MNHQVNLLPDVKQQRLRQHKLRQLAISASIFIIAVAVGIPILLLLAKGSQIIYINRVQSQIDENIQTLRNTPDINTMLTIKDHLNSLTTLYAGRTLPSKLLALLPSVTPKDIVLNSIDTDLAAHSISFTGSANSYNLVNKFYHALLESGVSVDHNKVDPDPNTSGNFTNVVLTSAAGPSGDQVTFQIEANFDVRLTSVSR